MLIWLVLFFHLMGSPQPYETVKYGGLVAQSTPWDCGAAAAASLFTLAGQHTEPRFDAYEEGSGASLSSLCLYFEARGWNTAAYNLTWDHILHFFEHFPNRPLLAHRSFEQGHYVVLLGMVQDFLVVADPASGVRAVSPQTFLEDFSGVTLHFPDLPPLSTIGKILHSVDQRLRLLRQSVAEF
ncbi:MAG TPA: hypothetical protein GXZ85_05775 [Firmicutes bacterium]|nr:hypothetical protein [Bacillota bacterium]